LKYLALSVQKNAQDSQNLKMGRVITIHTRNNYMCI